MWNERTPMKYKVLDIVMLGYAVLFGIAFSYGILARFLQ